MNPYASALADYYAGVREHPLFVCASDGRRMLIHLERLFTSGAFGELESRALGECKGRVLDVGAGVGRHSLWLGARGFDCVPIDISSEAVRIMRTRGLAAARRADVFTYRGGPFDTVLLLWHGLGIGGTPDGLERLLARAAARLAPHGQILAESVEPLSDRCGERAGYEALAYQFEYRGMRGEPFPWLNVGFEPLREVAARVGLTAERLAYDDAGAYLCRLVGAAQQSQEVLPTGI